MTTLRFNLILRLLRQWRHRHQQQNLNPRRTRRSLKLHDPFSQNQSTGLGFASQNQVSSSLRFRNRAGYPNLFDRLTPKR